MELAGKFGTNAAGSKRRLLDDRSGEVFLAQALVYFLYTLVDVVDLEDFVYVLSGIVSDLLVPETLSRNLCMLP